MAVQARGYQPPRTGGDAGPKKTFGNSGKSLANPPAARHNSPVGLGKGRKVPDPPPGNRKRQSRKETPVAETKTPVQMVIEATQTLEAAKAKHKQAAKDAETLAKKRDRLAGEVTLAEQALEKAVQAMGKK